MLPKDLNGYFESEVVFEELKRVQPGSVQFSSAQRFSSKCQTKCQKEILLIFNILNFVYILLSHGDPSKIKITYNVKIVETSVIQRHAAIADIDMCNV